jgi:hypothetical protein
MKNKNLKMSTSKTSSTVTATIAVPSPVKAEFSQAKAAYDEDEHILCLIHDQKDGMDFFRQANRQNRYNPEGLSILTINLELKFALDLPSNRIPLVQQLLAEESAQATTNTRSQAPVEPIQAGDKDLAELIKACPQALIESRHAQDAFSRWTYTSRCHHDTKMRNRAQGLLVNCFPRRMGNPGKVKPDLPRLRLAYDDLCAYCKCVFAAAAKCSVPEIQKLFVRVDDLVPFGLNLGDLMNPRFKKPAPSEIAASYIAANIGLSKSRVIDLVSMARS